MDIVIYLKYCYICPGLVTNHLKDFLFLLTFRMAKQDGGMMSAPIAVPYKLQFHKFETTSLRSFIQDSLDVQFGVYFFRWFVV